MNKKGRLLIIVAIVFILLGIVTLDTDYNKYCLFLFPVGVIFLVLGILSVRNKNPERSYEDTVNSIINTYDSILVKSNSVPNFEGRNIIEVMSFDDLIDAQLEIRKPICYMKQTESCSFALLDDKEAYVYVEKLNDQVLSPLEIEIKEYKIRNKNKDDVDAEMLRNIDKTTVVRLSNKKSYKVSPIRKKDKEENTKKDEVDKIEKTSKESENESRKGKDDIEQLEKTRKISKQEIKKAMTEDIEVLGDTRKIFKNELEEALRNEDIEELSNTHKISKKELEKALDEEIEYL